jgi:hypothetical protein
MRSISAGAQLGNAPAIDIEANDLKPCARKGRRNREADISEPNN